MLFHITELVLEYDPMEWIEWKLGNKDRILAGMPIHKELINQPTYHFGEYFTLRHFRQMGWNGFVFYSFYDRCLPKYQAGHQKLVEIFTQEQLKTFQSARNHTGDSKKKGDPDVFLYKTDGSTCFLEVKKKGDTIKPEQLECLAQIRKIFKAEVGIVHVIEKGHHSVPRNYELDLETARASGFEKA